MKNLKKITEPVKYLLKNILINEVRYFNTRENSVLLIEFTKVHGEVMPGLAKYLLDMGFNVDILVGGEMTLVCFIASMKMKK